MKAVRVICKGKVQGVFFRVSTQSKAEALGVLGWVRNEPNGDVLIHAQGEDAVVDELLTWCQRGPRLARVDAIEVENVKEEVLTTFKVRHG